MNKKTIWWGVGVVVVVAIIIIVAMPHGGSSSPAATGNQVQSSNTQVASAMSLKDLLSAGVSQQCAFSSQSATSSLVAGTVYVTSGHMRGDFSAQSASGIIASHMITDGQTAYVWTDSPAQGMKMSFAAVTPTQGTKAQGSVDPNAKMNYSCTSWPVDQSKFTIPTNVTFTDMSAMMNTGTGANAGASASANMCSMCAEAGSPSAVAQCKVAMHC